jgi:hypothetical protein
MTTFEMSFQNVFEPGLEATHRVVQAPILDTPPPIPQLHPNPPGGNEPAAQGSRTTADQILHLRQGLLTLLKGRTLGMSVAMIRAHIADFLKFEQVCGRIQAYHMSEDDIRTIDILFPDDVAYFTISLKFSEII